MLDAPLTLWLAAIALLTIRLDTQSGANSVVPLLYADDKFRSPDTYLLD